ncbi:MAG: hypothetical protein EPN70_06340 [Paraburkholderia sp.]|uniref:hypothetical protein n=1 Tax=Paraburkholderia sp. TaxID=1926495 RepID=UPI0011F455CB|nr:hypothetical protein [Paraburkholderia sp.]TAM06229.1 MAG: hypothetical protein EPN70_06340 [Paraburkholderia sp.]TAM31924.1 MAG: hypothetical protein EPN59_02985 [Paraburkholderia sp.]
MKRLFAAALLALSTTVFGATLSPITLLNPTGSTSGQVITSMGPTGAPAWQTVALSGVSGTLAIANGGTAATTRAGALANILGGLTVPVVNGGTGVTSAAAELSRIGAAPLASPAFTGTPAAPTATGGTNTTQIATTAFVQSAVSGATSAGGQPYFKATMSANQTLTAGSVAKITFNTKAEDSNTEYDATTNYRFTPQKSGLYMVTVYLYMTGTNTTAGNYTAASMIYKNGAMSAENIFTGYAGVSSSLAYVLPVTALIRMNGSTDYVEADGVINAGQTTPTVSNALSFFQEYYVGP